MTTAEYPAWAVVCGRSTSMRELIFALTHYAAAGLLALLAYVFGRRLTFGVRYNSVLEQVSYSTALGLGLIAYLVFLRGFVVSCIRRLSQSFIGWLVDLPRSGFELAQPE
jgi:hypothetical protein